MRTMVIAVALLALALVPAAADPIQGPYNQDVDVEINVEPYGELWHANEDNIAENTVSLTLADGGSYFGRTLNMWMNGNTPFEVYLSGDGELPKEVDLHVGIKFDGFIGDWTEVSGSGGLYRLYHRDGTPDAYATQVVSFHWNLGPDWTNTQVWSYNPGTVPPGGAEAVPILYSIIASGTPAIAEDASTFKAVYTMQTPNVEG